MSIFEYTGFSNLWILINVTCLSWVYLLPYCQVRDYIHVVDLADGHISALNKLSDPSVGMIYE